MTCKIEIVSSPYAVDLLRARSDYAKICQQELVERSYWYRNVETGQLYYDIYACLGWPSEVTDSSDGLPGYASVVGVVRPKSESDTNDPRDAKFQLLAETESKDVPTLLQGCLKLREEYGFGIHPDLLTFFFGDPERFCIPMALFNEDLIEKGGENNALLLTPYDEMYTRKVFDSYVRALRSTLVDGSIRFFFGYNSILKNKFREFLRDDPAVFAAGGLVFSLVNRVRWMDAIGESVFTVEDENEL